MSQPLYIVDGIRTPFCKMGTSLANIDAVELGRTAVTQLLARTGIDPAIIAEVIFGCVGQPSDAANISRVIALRSGIPEDVPAITVHRNCASGFEALTQAHEKMIAGRGDVFLIGGTESMTHIPLLYSERATKKFTKLSRAKSPVQSLKSALSFRPSDFKPRVGLMEGLTDPTCGLNMGQTAENLAIDFHISREEQDAFALRSHQRATQARDKLEEEITPVFHSDGLIALDNGIRENQSLEALAKLRPVFDKHNGSVTAGNSSQITDGAVALLVMSEKALKEHNLTPLGKLLCWEYAGCRPSHMGLGPVHTIHHAEQTCGLGLEEADLIEINEAFAAQVLGCIKASASAEYCRHALDRQSPLGNIPMDKLNVNGGAIALGHPVGATGSRLILSTLKELKRRNKTHALVSLCVGGGQGGALWLECN